ncbi:MAG: hypothetical protein HY659_03355 [Rhizobiales bacterium]|nr:hypothetical protein [Hyphomicrobiales bacterium]
MVSSIKPSLLAALILLAVTDASHSQSGEKLTWTFGEQDGMAYLAYGGESPEATVISFSCKPSYKKVKIIISETSEALKPNRAVAATLAAGTTKITVNGNTIPNEDAGVPSFEAVLSASTPLFPALAVSAKLSIVVGPHKQDVPLQMIGRKAVDFVKQCAKSDR